MANSSPRIPLPRAARGQGSALAEKAYGRIREAIASLDLQPGQSLTEASVSEWLGIGRMPVREALLRLREEGLVESVPRRGYYVSRISADEAQEIYEMLEGLEGSAAKLAAQRAGPEGIARLEAAILRLE
ncbi:MAG TPA: GntR family transcriptional regulator, partial [Chloroflexota bacterium]|nr:GntR family transcriptional regulator [Chloroflexota bacterium]